MLSKDRVKRIAKVTLWQRMLTGLREGLGLGPGMPELTAQYSRGAPSSLMLMKFGGARWQPLGRVTGNTI